MSLKCKVIFPESPENVFYTGQTVCGNVQVIAEQEQPVSSIRIDLSGVVISSLNQNDKVHMYRENFFRRQMSILASEQRLSAVKEHSFPFELELPSRVPASFEGTQGYIRYQLTTTIESPGQPNGVFIQPITISTQISPNNVKLARIFRPRVFKPNFLATCFGLFPIEIEAYVTPSAYAPGAFIHVRMNETNTSFWRIRDFHFELIEEVTYYSADKSQKMATTTILNEKKFRGLSTKQIWTVCREFHLDVPHTTQIDTTSTLIDVQHFVKITVNLRSRFRQSKAFKLPITIVGRISEAES